jgi:hypothetical protein
VQLTGWRFLLAVAVLPAPVALCTVIVEIPFDQLCAQADVVVVGTVTSIESRRPTGCCNIYTWTTFRVDEWVAGAGKHDRLTIRTLGGSAEGETLRVHGMPCFEVGRQYVLLLEQPRRTICPVVGWTQGCFHVERSGSAEIPRVRTYHGKRVSQVVRGDIETRPKATTQASREAPMTLDAFLAEIKAARARADSAQQRTDRRQ